MISVLIISTSLPKISQLLQFFFCSQVGDVVVLDIAATTIDQDESNVKSIPSEESKGRVMCLKDDNKMINDGSLFFVIHREHISSKPILDMQALILIQNMVKKYYRVSLIV